MHRRGIPIEGTGKPLPYAHQAVFLRKTGILQHALCLVLSVQINGRKDRRRRNDKLGRGRLFCLCVKADKGKASLGVQRCDPFCLFRCAVHLYIAAVCKGIVAFMTHPLSTGFVRNARKKFIILHFLCIFQIFQAYFDRNSRKPSPPLFCKKVPIAGNAASAMGTFVGFCEMEIRRTRRR